MNTAFWKGKRVLVTGADGFIGSYVIELLESECGVSSDMIRAPRHRDCDLLDLAACQRAVANCEIVIHLAAVTGGIGFSRMHPATQYHLSTSIDLNMITAARESGVQKFVALGNLFAYASDAPIPLLESSLFDGLPTDAHRGVGWMKRNLALMADIYFREFGFPMVVVYSANAYGPRDSLDPKHSHVIPSTIMKCLSQNSLVVWGDGSPTRDFLYAEDVARGILLATDKLAPPQYINIGSGSEISVRELVGLIAHHTEFRGPVSFDASKAGGDARRCVDISRARALLGFEPKISMEAGIERTVKWYKERFEIARF